MRLYHWMIELSWTWRWNTTLIHKLIFLHACIIFAECFMNHTYIVGFITISYYEPTWETFIYFQQFQSFLFQLSSVGNLMWKEIPVKKKTLVRFILQDFKEDVQIGSYIPLWAKDLPLFRQCLCVLYTCQIMR